MDWLTPEQRRRNMAAIRAKGTKPEMIVRRLVFSLGYRYRLHVKDLPSSPDLVFPRLRKIIEVRGCFWHRHSCKDGARTPEANAEYWAQKIQRNAERDRLNEEKLKQLGWEILIIWDCQTRKREELLNRVACFLSTAGTSKRTSPTKTILGPTNA
jgi:DNA mismatch endonuclease, patch repair protein